MLVGELELEYYIDYLEKRFHLLEKDRMMFRGLPNLIDSDFQRKIIKQENLLLGVLDFEWVLYCSSGLVMTYKDFNLQLMPKYEKWLHRPFLDVIDDV